MSSWPSTKAKRVLAALERLGWSIKRQSGSHAAQWDGGKPQGAHIALSHDGIPVSHMVLEDRG